MNNFATISDKSERYQEWIDVFGTDRIPIINCMIPDRLNIRGIVREAYMIDLKKLSAEQMERMIDHISRKFAIPFKEVKAELPKIGVPILAEDVCVSTDSMAFL